METHLADWLKDTPDGIEAESILRKCVHCGFCTATCPTYQILGDELDGPRGRIYLIKQVVEGVEPTASTQLHLDRCLTCRNCETTCPSGVQYGRLIDIGRKLVDAKVERPLAQRLLRSALKNGMTTRGVFEPAMRVGQLVRPLLPSALKDKVPARRLGANVVSEARQSDPSRQYTRTVLMLNGCVQPAMSPTIDTATVRVLDRFNVKVVVAPKSGCCGAVKHHLNDHHGGLHDAKRNIDAWWPHIQSGIDAIVMNASGCGAMIKDYGHLLRDDPQYAEKAAKVSDLCKDLIEYLPQLPELLNGSTNWQMQLQKQAMQAAAKTKVSFHPPCTLQHGQQIKGAVEQLLVACGVDLQVVADSHLCCGSAGTYSVLQPELSKELRKRKLANLEEQNPEVILSANIGCLAHLQAGTTTPVRHWVEWLDEVLTR